MDFRELNCSTWFAMSVLFPVRKQSSSMEIRHAAQLTVSYNTLYNVSISAAVLCGLNATTLIILYRYYGEIHTECTHMYLSFTMSIVIQFVDVHKVAMIPYPLVTERTH